MISSSPVLAQDNSLNAPEVLDLDDPFARGINRAADQASDGWRYPDQNGKPQALVVQAKDLAAEARALRVNLYRVAALAVTEGSARGQIFELVIKMSQKALALKFYLRLGSLTNSANARQAAINLKNIMEGHIGGHFILGDTSPGIDLDIGPLRQCASRRKYYCEIMLAMSNGIVSDCYAVLEYPGYEPLDTFTSTAMLRLSADAIQNVLVDENNVFNLQDTSRKLIQVKEGEMLGNAGVDQIVKSPHQVFCLSLMKV